MCWKLVDDLSGEIICRSTICSAIDLGTANLQVDLVEPIEEYYNTNPDGNLHTEIFSLDNDDSIASNPAIPNSISWYDKVQGNKHHENIQQRQFHLEQPKVIKRQQQYLTRFNQQKLIQLSLMKMGSKHHLSISDMMRRRRIHQFGNNKIHHSQQFRRTKDG